MIIELFATKLLLSVKSSGNYSKYI